MTANLTLCSPTPLCIGCATRRALLRAIARALKPGGRLVFEMGGRGNIQQIWKAAMQAPS